MKFCCSGYPCRPIIWLSLSRGRMGQAIHRTKTGSSAVLLCRATQTVRQPNRCRALGQPTLSKFTLLQLMSSFAIYLVAFIQITKSHCKNTLGKDLNVLLLASRTRVHSLWLATKSLVLKTNPCMPNKSHARS